MIERSIAADEFRETLAAVPLLERDAFVDRLFGVEAVADDGPELPREAVGYLPCPVGTLLAAIALARIGPADVFLDVGSGAGRAAMVIHLCTGAKVVGVEVQPHLVREAEQLGRRLGRALEWVEGDAVESIDRVTAPTVVFLYCPFSSERAEAFLERVRRLPRLRPLRVCSVDLPLSSAWLTKTAAVDGLAVFEER